MQIWKKGFENDMVKYGKVVFKEKKIILSENISKPYLYINYRPDFGTLRFVQLYKCILIPTKHSFQVLPIKLTGIHIIVLTN